MDIMEVDFNKLVAMVDELNAIDVVVFDEVKVMVLLISLLENYQNLITTLENYQLGNWMWDMVSTRLLNEKLTKREQGNLQSDGEIVALMIEKSNSQSGRDWNKDIYNYYKEQGLENARREKKTCKEKEE